jgi:hypothetical protein
MAGLDPAIHAVKTPHALTNAPRHFSRRAPV